MEAKPIVTYIKWRHKTCIGMSTTEFSEIGKSEGTWTCSSCSKKNNSSMKIYHVPSEDNNSSLNISTNPLLLDSISEVSMPSTSGSSIYSPSFSSTSFNSTDIPIMSSSPKPAKPKPTAKKTLRILNINFQSLRKKGKLLETIIDSTDPDVIIGTETWLDPNIKSSEIIPDYQHYDIVRRDRPTDPHGGVMLATKKALLLGNINKSSNIELISGTINLEGKKKMLIGSYYRPPDKTNDSYLNQVKEEISNIRWKHKKDLFVIGGDFNLPDINWNEQSIINNQYPSRVNQTFLDIVADNGLEQIVDFSTRKDNILDLMLISHPAFKQRCKPLPSIGNSDHDIVLLDIACKPFKPKPSAKCSTQLNWQNLQLLEGGLLYCKSRSCRSAGHGDQVIFSSLHRTLVNTLPIEPTEWRRSYGRPPKTVHIEASFVPYDEDILPKETDKTLVSRPYFHIFWADADLENYKQTVKEELTEWHTALKNSNIPDWLIVVVNNDETKGKTKLLPRSSVIDKVKSDFCSKQPDRCIAIIEPLRQEPKCQELWKALLQRLRNLLLQAYNRHLSKYEENMRLLREKRNDPGWGFIPFFLIQEELAFMFEMLGLYDEAMIQYDELDALFSQFVIDKVSGTAHPWLTDLILDCKSWAGISLQKAINHDKRDQIKDNKASLIEFRNYLFSRQCALLFLLGKPSEVSRRAMEFLFNTVLEVKKLKMKVIPGALDCWSFVSALEVLHSCEKYVDLYNTEMLYLYRATLWDHARKKLYSLGELCGLMPEDDIQPTSEQLTMVLDFTSGMGIADDIDSGSEYHEPTPRDKLREALSSKDSFQKIYLELLEQATGTFKHIGRYRCARLITKDLALFYMRMGHPEKAENYLSEAVKSYHQEGWTQLSEGTMLDLAKCQDKLNHRHKFLQTAVKISSSTTLPEADRKKYFDRICEEAKKPIDSSPLKTSSLFRVEEINFPKTEIYIDHMIEIEIKINCKVPCDVSCDKISLSFIETKSSQEGNSKAVVCRQASDTSLTDHVANCKPMAKLNLNMIPLQENMEGSLDSPMLCGVFCFQSKELLRRADSTGSKGQTKMPLITKEDFVFSITGQDLVLKPGDNVIVLSKKIEKVGQYKANQFWIEIGHLEFIKTLDEEKTFSSTYLQPHCEIRPVSRDKLLMGLENKVELIIENSASSLEQGSKLEIITSPEVEVQATDAGRILSVDEISEEENLKFNFSLLHDIVDGDSIEMEVKIACDKFPKPLIATVTFVSPLLASSKVHTANKRKYLQIVLEGNSDSNFTLSNPSASSTINDVEFMCLSKPNQSWNVYKNQRVSYLWEIKCNTDSVTSLPVSFQVDYCCSIEQKTRKFVYCCHVDNFRTQYHVRVSVMPTEENKHCQVSTLSCMKVEITSLSSSYKDDRVLYEVEDDSFWAVSGKSAGFINITHGHGNVQLDVMPVTSGHVPVPNVTLFQCVESNETTEKEDIDSDTLPSSTPQKSTQDSVKEPFQQGQVYYASIAKQVLVYQQSINSKKETVIDNKLKDTKM